MNPKEHFYPKTDNLTCGITLQDIYQARQPIVDVARRTPIIDCPRLSENLAAQVIFKLENVQTTGSFKIRGAVNKLRNLPEDARSLGVITVSSGNHGRAVSYVAGKLGIRAVVFITNTVPEIKREAMRRMGAEVILCGQTYEEALSKAVLMQQEQGLTMIPPFDDPFVIAGQGTIGLELLEDFPEIDTVVVPLSGGGLLSGIAFTLKTVNAGIRTIGVSMERGAAMVASLRAGEIVDVAEESSLADALIGGIGLNNVCTFNMIREYVDDTVLVSEQEIAVAMAFALKEHHLVVEGGGAVGIAALLHGKIKQLGQHVAVVVSGGNVDIPVLLDVARNHDL